ncbi:MAG: DEAD/DEAH box helicase [Armatimonadota bacterium]|nr:DEAD/DEAH box helicase [Armatimonadota bacterium]MCX7776445.1 DEAD/DEAH box helicase [Armatimonadota bacterium]MDW8024243.1 DEAD/DEAH box helicase [Armatimonadota bacterium]
MGKRMKHSKRKLRTKAKSKLDEVALRFLEGMGEPEPEPFKPSPFQEQALSEIMHSDVIVVAPTGSGKTWIAEQAMARWLNEGKRSWYTTPLKALSNQKYDSFGELFGRENVGLITGERRENTAAPIIVATTEVLRNALYSGFDAPDLIVLDEAHYIADPERGTTWEEVVILAPQSSRLLLLSATISNANEIAGWMEQVRGIRPSVVMAHERPVPLRYGFIDRDGRPLPCSKEMNLRRIKHLLHHGIDIVGIVASLRKWNLLPAIIFLPKRRDCDRAAQAFKNFLMEGAKEREEFIRQMIEEHERLAHHPLLSQLIKAGVAPHHAGHLTSWKVMVERMLRVGLIKAVFATTTLAAGLDVPARTVVLPTLMTRDESGGRLLSALEFHQMTGRAGRRGKDKVGFVLIVPRSVKDIEHAVRFIESKPEALESAFRVHYYQVLNLLSRYGYDGATEILEKSLAVYQWSKQGHRKGRRKRQEIREQFRRRARLLQELGYIDSDMSLTSIGQWALLIRHERSLFTVEAIRRGLCDELSPEELAGWAAAFTTERSPRALAKRLSLEKLAELAFEIEALEDAFGIEPSGFAEEFGEPGKPFGDAERRAACVYAWAIGVDWDKLVFKADADEGDLQRLILQAAEILRQVEDLPMNISETATIARHLIMRPPIV